MSNDQLNSDMRADGTMQQTVNIGAMAFVGARIVSLWTDIAKWSQETFGKDADRGPIGPLAHLEKEAREAQASPKDITEYADILILLFDAARRAGFTGYGLVKAAGDKMEINKRRVWPGITPETADKPMEHVKEQNHLEQAAMPRS